MSALRTRLVTAVEAVKAVAAAVEDLPQELRGAHETALLDDVQLIGELRRLCDALGVRAAGEFGRREADGHAIAMPHGWRTLPDLIAHTSGLPLSAAEQWCTVGAAVTPPTNLQGEALPAKRARVAAALDDGELSVEAAAVIARTLNQLDDRTPPDDRDGAERFLVQEAQVLTLRQLGRLCLALKDRLDPDGVEPREDLLRRRSGLRRIQKADGSVRWIIDADPESDGWLKSAMDARTAPRRQPRFSDPDDPTADPATADDRTVGQRRLAALVGMARDSLANDDGNIAGLPVTMLVTVALETLQTGIGAASIAGVDTPVSAATARRLACSANIIPVVLGGKSEVLDVGRARRFFTRAQRLAMAVRDGGCTWPGCEAPPGWCEAAHGRVPWHLGGPTQLDDGALLCPYHHHRLDNDGWQLEVRDGIPWFIPPPWVDPARRPRRGGRERLPERGVG